MLKFSNAGQKEIKGLDQGHVIKTYVTIKMS